MTLHKASRTRRVLHGKLDHLLVAEPPFLARDGGFIRAGAHAALDEVRSLRDESRRVIASLEARYREQTATFRSSIKHNGVLGYFIEVTPQHADKLQTAEHRRPFRHRQTIGSAVRFSTDELATLATRISQAADQALAIERELFDALVAETLAASAALAQVAGALARLDVAAALGELAVAARYARPIVDNSLAFEIERGRHPVVEAALAIGKRAPSCPTIAICRRTAWAVSGSSPAPTWPANRPFCARTR